MRITVSLFLYFYCDTVLAVAFHNIHVHIKPSLLGTSDMKRGVTVCLMALYTSPCIALFANVTGQLPPGGRNVFQIIDWLQKYCVAKANFRYPKSTYLNKQFFY